MARVVEKYAVYLKKLQDTEEKTNRKEAGFDPSQPSRKLIQRTIQKYIELAISHGLYDSKTVQRGLIPADLSEQGIKLVVNALKQDLLSSLPSSSSEPSPKRMKIQSIRVLKLGGFALGDVGARVLSQAIGGNNTLEGVDLGFNSIGDDGAKAIAEFILSRNRVSNLTSLYLTGNCIRVQGIKSLSDALETNTTLRTLYLSGNSLQPDAIQHLTAALKVNQGITTLYLGSNKLRTPGVRHLVHVLTPACHLKELMLGQNEIGADGIECLAEALQSTCTLTTLELASNDINSKSGVILANALQTQTHLENLYLNNNPLGDSAAAAFGIMLTKNTTLRVLDLSFTTLTLIGIRALATGIQYSKTLVSLMVEGNQVTQDVLAARVFAAALISNPHTRLVKLTGIKLQLALDELKVGESSLNETILAQVRQKNRRLSGQFSPREPPKRREALTELAQVDWIERSKADLEELNHLSFDAKELQALEMYYCEKQDETRPRIAQYARVELLASRTKDSIQRLDLLRRLHYLVHELDGLADADALIDTMLGI